MIMAHGEMNIKKKSFLDFIVQFQVKKMAVKVCTLSSCGLEETK
jgi:hypothetical protein